ncbi:alpha/beta hydrolase [Mycolicibacterium duvalii]|uniref:alpha/beta fold hydrolase n=1 Tax=Mycolicibacterium duvalii TaxID=39688 RepID=UPI000BEEACE8|nr:alpha/beta fold hydrolase [Mycolicibacterium duvalii]MCV7368511.1 alpha/beta fold hydrolase [Mycolicibacterium duvalii]PEG36769.1 alpha/beta hydrolase [Mycolicibacterium duvalii]
MPEFRFATHGGARIRYLDSGGDDRGAPIVFVPGFTDVADDYVEILPALGRRAAVVELRGHGHSTAGENRYDSAALAGDVGAVVDALTDGPVHVMSFSRGTAYAVSWALTNWPRVRSVSIGDYVPEELVVEEDAFDVLLDGRWRGTPVRDRLDRHAAVATFRAARPQSFWEPLSHWHPPLLAVRSPNVPLVSDEAWARYRALFPAARLEEFTDSPHDIFRPDRRRFPALVRELVDTADRAG